jgi:hypothetical protein
MTTTKRSPLASGIRLLTIAVLAAGCGSVTPGTPEPRASAPAPTGSLLVGTTGPSVTAAPIAPTPGGPSRAPSPADDLDPDSTAITVTDNLRVRTLPEVSDDSRLLEPLLDQGRALYVLSGPVDGSGFRWYEVYAPEVDLGGWVAAAGKDGERWIAPRPIECTLGVSEDPFFDDLGYPLVHLACYKDDVFGEQRTLAAVQDDGLRCPDVAPYWLEPDWLNFPLSCSYEGLDPQDVGAFDLLSSGVLHPSLEGTVAQMVEDANDPATGVTVNLIGRLDHPDARACTAVGDDPPSPIAALLQCRSAFVITGVEPAN